MIWIIPMAGKGTRTRSYGEFKPFIDVSGRFILEWLLISVRSNFKEGDHLVFVTTKYFNDKYSVARQLPHLLSELNIPYPFHLILAEDTPEGPAKSVYLANEFMTDQPCAILNSDQFINFAMPKLSCLECMLPVNVDFGQSKSYLLMEGIEPIGLLEKENTSCIASCGVYIIAKGADLKESLETMFESNERVKGEFFVAPALNNLVQKGYKFVPISVQARYDLGNINSIDIFTQFMRELLNSAI
ncbi:MAG: hypothetical protein HWD84_08360 [Flavobacteriaceae bacterium]|nr:hypothetical protein [Flavobacteriaceae bacterium]